MVRARESPSRSARKGTKLATIHERNRELEESEIALEEKREKEEALEERLKRLEYAIVDRQRVLRKLDKQIRKGVKYMEELESESERDIRGDRQRKRANTGRVRQIEEVSENESDGYTADKEKKMANTPRWRSSGSRGNAYSMYKTVFSLISPGYRSIMPCIIINK